MIVEKIPLLAFSNGTVTMTRFAICDSRRDLSSDLVFTLQCSILRCRRELQRDLSRDLGDYNESAVANRKSPEIRRKMPMCLQYHDLRRERDFRRRFWK